MREEGDIYTSEDEVILVYSCSKGGNCGTWDGSRWMDMIGQKWGQGYFARLDAVDG